MTRAQNHQMLDMRLDGYTYERIGELFGVSKQRVCQILSGQDACGRRGINKQNRLDNYVFPNIAIWMNEHNYSARRFSKEISVNDNSFSKYMRGENEPTLSVIKAIIEFTGMTFEEAFMQKSQE